MNNQSCHKPSTYAVTKEFIRERTANIGVVGLGQAGLPLALRLSNSGFTVLGFDIDAEKIGKLKARQSYFAHIPSEDIARAHRQGFRATTDMQQLAETDVVILCLSTPLNENHEPNSRRIREAAFSIAHCLHAGQLIILDGTTYPGTTEEVLVPILENANDAHLRVSRNTARPDEIFVAFSPECFSLGRPGDYDHDVPKIVGGIDSFSTDLALDVYAAIFRNVVPVSTPSIAEMSGLLEDSYYSVNSALVNEWKQLCMRMGIDIWEVLRATSTRPMDVHDFLPGPGLGGHRAPRASSYLSWKAKSYDFRARFTELASEVNSEMPYFVVQCASEALSQRKRPVNGSSILVLGLAYEKDIDDPCESPSLTIVELLRLAGACVDYNDPFLPHVGRGRHNDLNMISTPIDNVSNYDAVLIATDHSAYDYSKIVSQAKLVIDTRNATVGIDSDNIVRC